MHVHSLIFQGQLIEKKSNRQLGRVEKNAYKKEKKNEKKYFFVLNENGGSSGGSPGVSPGGSPGASDVRSAIKLLKIQRNLTLFELQYLDLHQVEEFHKAFIKGKTVDDYLFHAWLAMKLASSKPTEKESFELFLYQY